MSRPSSVSILALAFSLVGVVLVVIGVAVATVSGELRLQMYKFVLQMPGLPLADEFFGYDLTSILGNVGSGVLFSLAGISNFFGGIGLWKKRKWAQWLIITVFSLATFFMTYTIVRWFEFVIEYVPFSIPAVIVDFLVVFCLLRAKE